MAKDGVITHQLVSLVPTFDPSEDNVKIWSSKVSLLLNAWPSDKYQELATRLILNTKGSAFQKLQIQQKDLVIKGISGIKKIVKIVGGSWGQIPLEHRFELVEKALYRSQQKTDESSDSCINRIDNVWSELPLKGMTLEQAQAYALLRGSRLSADDRKRGLVEYGAESKGELEVSKVTSAIRMLGSSFFQECTGLRKDVKQKTYDQMAFGVDETDENEETESFWAQDDYLHDEVVANMAQEQDEDAAMIVSFVDAVAESMQSDPDLAAFFSSYQDARRRLTERVKFRGFWPVKKGGKGAGGSKGAKGGAKGKMTLAQKIANPRCRICQRGAGKQSAHEM